MNPQPPTPPYAPAQPEHWFVRIKVYNPAARCVRMRWVCTYPGLKRLFQGGDGVKNIPKWYKVTTEQAMKLAQEKQYPNDPFSPMLFDIVDEQTMHAINSREGAARRMILGMSNPEQAQQQAERAMAMATQAATAQFNPMGQNPFGPGAHSQLAPPPGMGQPSDPTTAVEDLTPQTAERQAAEEAAKLKQFEAATANPVLAATELNPQAYMAQQQPGAGAIASNPAAAQQITAMAQAMAQQMAHQMVQQMLSNKADGEVAPAVQTPPGAVAPPPPIEDAENAEKAGRAAAMEGIDEAAEALPAEPEAPTPSAEQAAPDPAPPAAAPPPADLAPPTTGAELDPNDPNNTAGAEDFDVEDSDVDETVSYTGEADPSVVRERSLSEKEAAADRQLAIKAIDRAGKEELLQFAEKQGLEVNTRLGVKKLRASIKEGMNL